MMTRTDTERSHDQDEARQRAREEIKTAASRGDGRGVLAAVRRLVSFAPKPADIAFAAGKLKAVIAATGAAALGLKAQKTFCVRSVTLEPLVPYLQVHGACGGLWLEFELGGYGSFAEEMMSPDGALLRSSPELVLFVVDTDDLAGDLRDACSSGHGAEIERVVEAAAKNASALITALRRQSAAKLLVQGLRVPAFPILGAVADANLPLGETEAIHRINQSLAAICRELQDAVFFDEDAVAARVGRAKWRDDRLFRSNRLAVAAQFFDEYARAMIACVRPLYFASRKVLCTDLDNTLWGGIVGEDGPDGIATGNTYPGCCYLEYQRMLRQLSKRGVLITIASKNNLADVKSAFERRRRDLAVSLEDFVAVEVSWESKAQALRRMATKLNVGIDSFVFVDDSEVECAEMRQLLPEVLVVQAPADEPWRLVECITALDAFDQVIVTDDDRGRVNAYRAENERAVLEASALSREEFLGSLGIVCTVLPALEAPLARTAQLLGKTNQFNLTTRRHSEREIERLAISPGAQAWAIRVRDRFGDAGVVGVALATLEERRCLIDSFLLSCRVIGRGVESALLWHVAQNAKRVGATRLVGEYLPTPKNLPCADMYPRHGFTEVGPSPEGGRLFALELTDAPLQLPPWITFEEAPSTR